MTQTGRVVSERGREQRRQTKGRESQRGQGENADTLRLASSGKQGFRKRTRHPWTEIVWDSKAALVLQQWRDTRGRKPRLVGRRHHCVIECFMDSPAHPHHDGRGVPVVQG